MRKDQEDVLAIVQFIHPGKEHGADKDRIKNWNTLDRPHRRKFILSEGTRIEKGRSINGLIGFWGEWEPPSIVHKIDTTSFSRTLRNGPKYFHTTAFPQSIHRYNGLHDTDPFVFGNRFLYNGCQQHTTGGTVDTLLRWLAPGSLILFGSAVDKRFVLDTALVVKDYKDYPRGDYNSLEGLVPDMYYGAALHPQSLVDEAVDSFRLYRGKNYADDWPFSFVPCVAMERNMLGFARPNIILPSAITQNLSQGKKITRATEAQIENAWLSVLRQVEEQGCSAGTKVALSPIVFDGNYNAE